MARALRSSGAPPAPPTTTPVPAATTNGAVRSRVLKRKRTDEDQQASPRPAAPGELHDESSASPLTDLAPSPAVKHEALDDGPLKEISRSPTPGAFLDGSDVPPSPADAHKLLTVLEMFDTHNLLVRHVPPADLSLRAMLKSPTHTLRTLRAAVTSLIPAQSNSRAALSLELSAQRSFCELALGLLDEIAQKQLVSKNRTSIYQVSAEHKSKHRSESAQPVRFALRQTIHGIDYYTSFADEALAPQKAASLSTGQASLTAIIPSLSIPVSSMPTLGAYSRKPITYTSPPQPPPYTLPTMLELSYGPRSSFAPTYDSAGSAITRMTMDVHVARRIEMRRARKVLGPPPVMGTEKDVQMVDNVKSASPHPDLVPIDPSLSEPNPQSPSPNPDIDADLTAALEELALEDSVRGLLQSNARAMAHLLDLQNERLRRFDGRDLSVLDPSEEEEKLAGCIERTLGMLVELRPRTLLASVSTSEPTRPSAEPTSIVPPASALRALHRTLPTEPTPGYRGTLDPRKESALKDNATIKVGNVLPPAPAPVQTGTPVSSAKPVAGRPGQVYGSQYPVQQYPATYQYTAGQTGYPTPGQAGYATPTAGQTGYATPTAYPANTYPAPVAAAQGGTYPATVQAGTYPALGQGAAYPTPGQAATYPTPGQPATYPTPNSAYPTPTAVGGASTPRVITNVVKPAVQGVWSPGQGYTPTPTTAGAYTPTVTYSPAVGTTVYNPAVNATGYNPAVNAATSAYNPAVAPAAGYNPAVAPATAYNPAVPAYTPGGYTATPTKPAPIAATPARGPIPLHVRSTPTPGTPGSPATYLPNTAGWNGTPARPT
ncbi:hypothetical protein RhiLY_13579 [Ceratobasidium sp. AG-Ba]|nr:hypothetical protein RhiLY_13579 [Ceratobasidium sp. AG-Ba]